MSARAPRARRAAAALLLASLAVAAVALGRLGASQAQPPPDDLEPIEEPVEEPIEEPGEEPEAVEASPHVVELPVVEVESSTHGEPQQVIVGTYVHNVEAIDLETNSYRVSLELWMKWRGPIDPTRSFRLTNVLEESSLSIRPAYPHPVDVEGYEYQRFHIEGRFFHKFWLGTFPLDWQRVTVELEDTQYPTDVLTYVPDQTSSGVDEVVRLPGWRIVETTTDATVAQRGSDYGMGSASPGDRFARYELSLRIERPVSFYLFRIIPPILITLACCLLVFLLRPSYVDARVGTPIAGLLTAVFLQLTFTAGLPNVGMMLLLDHVFNLTYGVIFVVALSCIMTSKSVDEIEELREAERGAETVAERARLHARVTLLDRRMHAINRRTMLALPAVYLVGVVAITIAVRGAYVFEMFAR